MHALFERASGLTEAIIAAAIEVHCDKGPGLIESIYEWCLLKELGLRGLECVSQKSVLIEYKGFTREEPPTMASEETRRKKNMKKYIDVTTFALCFSTLVLVAPTSFAQNAAGISKAEAISQQLNLTPQQKVKILPILREEAPKVAAIKNDNSLSRIQKMQQIRAIHQQTDPQMKAILSPEQYQKLQAIRQQTIREAMQTRHG